MPSIPPAAKNGKASKNKSIERVKSPFTIALLRKKVEPPMPCIGAAELPMKS